MIKQETIHDTGLKMTTKLAKSSYRDTGFLNNATTNERQRIIALSMYYQLGKFDPSNQFIKYLQRQKHDQQDIHAISERMEQNKSNKGKNKNKNKE